MGRGDQPAYPFKTTRISRIQAVEYIAGIVHPNAKKKSELRSAKITVNSTVWYAIKSGKLHRDHKDTLLATDLFAWALEKKKWAPRLAQIPGLPIPTSGANLSFSFSSIGEGGPIPIDPREMANLISNLRAQLFHCNRDNERLRQENLTLQAAANAREVKKKELSKKNSDNAKKRRNQ